MKRVGGWDLKSENRDRRNSGEVEKLCGFISRDRESPFSSAEILSPIRLGKPTRGQNGNSRPIAKRNTTDE